MDVIFIDCKTIQANDTIISFIKSNSNSKNSIIVGMDDEQCQNQFEGIDFTVSSKNLFEDLKELQNKFMDRIANQNVSKYNLNEINTFVSNYLLSLGFLPKHIGFAYMKQVIQIAVKHEMIGSLSKDIYPIVASTFKTQVQNVERNIRNAIERACNSKEMKESEVGQLLVNGKISNRAFLSYLLDKVLNEFSF